MLGLCNSFCAQGQKGLDMLSLQRNIGFLSANLKVQAPTVFFLKNEPEVCKDVGCLEQDAMFHFLYHLSIISLMMIVFPQMSSNWKEEGVIPTRCPPVMCWRGPLLTWHQAHPGVTQFHWLNPLTSINTTHSVCQLSFWSWSGVYERWSVPCVS